MPDGEWTALLGSKFQLPSGFEAMAAILQLLLVNLKEAPIKG